MRFGDSSFGFGGWHKVTWVGLGWGQPLWDWGNTFLVSGAGDKGNWGFGVGLGDNLYGGNPFWFWGDLGFRGGTCLGTPLWDLGTTLGSGASGMRHVCKFKARHQPQPHTISCVASHMCASSRNVTSKEAKLRVRNEPLHPMGLGTDGDMWMQWRSVCGIRDVVAEKNWGKSKFTNHVHWDPLLVEPLDHPTKEEWK